MAVDSLGVGSGISPALRLTWAVAGRYRFERLIRLNGPTVRTDYRLIAIAPDLPFLWAMHPLLALEPGAQLAIAGVAEVTVTNGAGLDLRTTGGRVGWPVGDLRTGGTVDLSRVPDTDAGIVRKLYADAAALEGPAIAWQPDGAGIAIDWDRQVAPSLGIWIDAGGWPVGAGRQQVALEPTTAPFDDLATCDRARSSGVGAARTRRPVVGDDPAREPRSGPGDPEMTRRARAPRASPGAVDAWSEPVVIPTYPTMPADRNPMFLEKRVYQGSSGRVYPNPFTDRVSDERVRPDVAGRPPRERVRPADDPARDRRADPRRAGQDQRLRLLLSPARDQAGAGRAARSVDLRRRRVQLAAAPSTVDVHAGRLGDRGGGRRGSDRLAAASTSRWTG